MLYTVVTISHGPEMPLLKLQARSLNKYLDRSFIKEIIVIDNSTDEPLDWRELAPQYGSLPVRFMKASQITSMPPAHGWFTQQVLKLMIARHIRTRRYILLDTKNHLIKPIGVGEFEAPDGRIRTGWHPYTNHPLKDYLLRACRYMRMKPWVMSHFIPTTTPFTMMTGVTRQLLNWVEKREGCAFAEAFVKYRLTEFFLYGTFLASIGCLNSCYKFDNWLGTTLWKHYDNPKMQKIIANPQSAFFSVHRNTFRSMNDQTRDDLANLWKRRGLFASYSDARRFVNGCASKYLR